MHVGEVKRGSCDMQTTKKNNKVVNPKGRYTIHSSHTCVPPEKDVMTFLSFDPGKKTFDVRLERTYTQTNKIETMWQSNHALAFQRHRVPHNGAQQAVKGGGKKKECTKSFLTASVLDILERYMQFSKGCVDTVVIERQMEVNTNMEILQFILITYFTVKWPGIFV